MGVFQVLQHEYPLRQLLVEVHSGAQAASPLYCTQVLPVGQGAFLQSCVQEPPGNEIGVRWPMLIPQCMPEPQSASVAQAEPMPGGGGGLRSAGCGIGALGVGVCVGVCDAEPASGGIGAAGSSGGTSKPRTEKLQAERTSTANDIRGMPGADVQAAFRDRRRRDSRSRRR